MLALEKCSQLFLNNSRFFPTNVLPEGRGYGEELLTVIAAGDFTDACAEQALAAFLNPPSCTLF